jgi:hypothetical protein
LKAFNLLPVDNYTGIALNLVWYGDSNISENYTGPIFMQRGGEERGGNGIKMGMG